MKPQMARPLVELPDNRYLYDLTWAEMAKIAAGSLLLVVAFTAILFALAVVAP